MSKAGDWLVMCCNAVGRLPSLVLCFLVIMLQICLVDYYLIHYLSTRHLFWAAGDIIVLILVILCFLVTPSPSQTTPHPSSSSSSSPHNGHSQQIDVGKPENENSGHHKISTRNYTVVWVTWAFMQALLSAKIIVICSTFSTELEEVEGKSFFGPNTFKTSIALGSCIFVLLLCSQHDASPGSERRRYIEELTGTVIFDILDTADILDVLFDADEHPGLASGIPEMVLAVASLNLLLPTVPLITLSRTKFGLEKLSKRMVYIHRLLMVMLVNVPSMATRMVLWHGFSVGVSPFTLKNLLIIVLTAYEFYAHKKERFEAHRMEAELEMEEFDENVNEDNVGAEDRINSGSGSPGAHGRKVTDLSSRGLMDGRNKSYKSRTPRSDGVHFKIESRIVTSM